MHSPLHTAKSKATADVSAATGKAQFPAAQPHPLQLQSAYVPAQLNGGWLISQLWSLASNPYVLTAGLISLPIIYWLTKRSKGIKAPPPDELCEILKVDKEKLINYLNNEDGGFTEEEAKKFLIDFSENRKVKQNYKPIDEWGLVPSVLIDGLTGNDSQKVDMLFDRFNTYKFTYTGIGQPVLEGFMSKSGDCKTLTNMFIRAVHAAGIQDIKYESYPDDMLVAKGPIHGRNKQGNVLEEKCWFFTDHHWVTYKGQVYDLLFMSRQKPVTYYLTDTQKYRGLTCKLFENGHCFISASDLAEQLDFNAGDVMGMVFEGGLEEASEFIDQHI